MSDDTPPTDQRFDTVMASRIHIASPGLARRWLERLSDVLSVERDDIFPTTDLLDHIPQLIQQIAGYVSAGVPLDDDTVRKWLREAAELLPPK